MSFDLINSAMSAAVMRALGSVVIVHSSQRGTITTCRAVIDKDVEVFPGGFDSGVSERMTEITFLKSDVPKIRREDIVVHGTTAYTVYDVVEDDGAIIRMTAK